MSSFLPGAVAHLLGAQVIGTVTAVSGGSINDVYRVTTQHGSVCVKVGELAAASMFEAEAAGLRELKVSGAIRVPNVLAVETFENQAFLCLEWLSLGSKTALAEAKLGEQLAVMHRHCAPRHGWTRGNFIGSTPQLNAPHDDWATFFRTQRLEPQLDLAGDHGADLATIERGRRLCEVLDMLLSGHHPCPSLLHGDLWSGNWGALAHGQPAIFDPATYYGDRETDIAMTRLFGGFAPDFYDAYESAWPLEQGAATRASLYNLYHVLNHFNLFGGSYLSQARSLIDQLLAQAGN